MAKAHELLDSKACRLPGAHTAEACQGQNATIADSSMTIIIAMVGTPCSNQSKQEKEC